MNHSTPHIAFLGGGNMATALITGMVHKGGFVPAQISVVDPNEGQRARLTDELGVATHESLAFAAVQMTTTPDVWVLAVKPQSMHQALRELAPLLNPQQVLLSIAAGLPIATLSNWSGHQGKIVRTMPNTPALIGQGITGVFAPDLLTTARSWVNDILQSIGQLVWLDDEHQIDAITAISGSGPAYVFYMMEHLVQEARDLGFDAETARQLVQATFSGAVALAGESTETIATLRERVTSKGGTTSAALSAFTRQGLGEALHAGVLACYTRAQSLAKELTV